MKRIATIVLFTVLVGLMLSPVSAAVNNYSGNPVLKADGVTPPPPFPSVTLMADGVTPPPPFPSVTLMADGVTPPPPFPSVTLMADGVTPPPPFPSLTVALA